jgi:hypothetical protein
MSEISGDEQRKREKRLVRKDRMAMAAVTAALLVLVLMMFSGAVMNFQCSTWDMLKLECNRFDAKFKKWE